MVNVPQAEPIFRNYGVPSEKLERTLRITEIADLHGIVSNDAEASF